MRLRSLPAGVNATASQALSSVRSFAFLVIAARTLTPEDFGFVAIVTTAAIALNELLRATASHPLALVYDDAPVDDDGPLAGAVSLHVLLAAAVGVAGAAALVMTVRGATSLMVGSAVYVGVGWLDALRTGSINRGRSDRSVLIDGAWLVLLLGALPGILGRSPSATAAVLTWGASAAATALLATMACGLRLSFRSARKYWESAKGVARPLAAQVGFESVPTRLAPLIIAGMVSVEAAGSIRGAEVLLGGAAMVYSGVAAAALRQARQDVVSRPHAVVVRKTANRFGLVIGAIALNLGIVLMLPDRVGSAILGDSWDGASEFAPIQALVLTSLVVFAAISVVMRASLALSSLLRIGAIGALATLVLVPSATTLGGAKVGFGMIAVAAGIMVLAGVRWIVRFGSVPARV